MSEEQNLERSSKEQGASEKPKNSDPIAIGLKKQREKNFEPQTSNLSAEDLSKADIKPETTNMETHAHHLHKAPGKKWTHYLFEFLMLFLAVFCGFLAENLREHWVNMGMEKQYVRSFYEDLTADENGLQEIIDNLDKQVRIADSLVLLMNNADTAKPANLIYMYLREITRSSSMLRYVNDRTIVQLRNAGGMRLIRNKNVSDSMVGYYKEVDFLQFLFEEALTIKRSLRESFQPLLKANDFAKVIDDTNKIINPPGILHLRTSDPATINNCLLEINNIRGLSRGTERRIQSLRNKAHQIREFIGKEYHLE